MAIPLPVNLDELDLKLAYEPRVEIKTRRIEVNYGDNYSETRLVGLNPHEHTQSLTWYSTNPKLTHDLIIAIKATGVGFVYFTEPHHYLNLGTYDPKKWTVNTFSVTFNSPILATIDMTLTTYRS